MWTVASQGNLLQLRWSSCYKRMTWSCFLGTWEIWSKSNWTPPNPKSNLKRRNPAPCLVPWRAVSSSAVAPKWRCRFHRRYPSTWDSLAEVVAKQQKHASIVPGVWLFLWSCINGDESHSKTSEFLFFCPSQGFLLGVPYVGAVRCSHLFCKGARLLFGRGGLLLGFVSLLCIFIINFRLDSKKKRHLRPLVMVIYIDLPCFFPIPLDFTFPFAARLRDGTDDPGGKDGDLVDGRICATESLDWMEKRHWQVRFDVFILGGFDITSYKQHLCVFIELPVVCCSLDWNHRFSWLFDSWH